MERKTNEHGRQQSGHIPTDISQGWERRATKSSSERLKIEAEFKLKRRCEDVDPVADGRDRRMSMADNSQAITQPTPVKVGNDE